MSRPVLVQICNGIQYRVPRDAHGGHDPVASPDRFLEITALRPIVESQGGNPGCCREHNAVQALAHKHVTLGNSSQQSVDAKLWTEDLRPMIELAREVLREKLVLSVERK